MRIIKIICWALLVALITFCFLIGLVAITLEVIGGDSVLFAGESQKIAASEARNLDDVHAASCRVVCSRSGSREGSIGTGTVVKLTAGRYWIITNWHVVNGFNQFRLDFFRDGKIFSVKATLEKSWHNEKAPWDFAILTVPQDKLASYNPPIVPLGQQSVKPLTDRPILSSGCSEGRWSLAWKGSVEDYYGNTAQFYPAPKSGQSGSAIVQSIDGQLQVTGILTWRVGDERSAGEEQMRGGAIPIANFYAAATGRQPTGEQNNIPPNAAFCDHGVKTPAVLSTETQPATTEKKDKKAAKDASKTKEKILPAIPRVWPVQSSTEYFDPKKPCHDGLKLFFFTMDNCVNCKKAYTIIEKLKKEDYPIETMDTSHSDDAAKAAKECGVKAYPTFLLVRDTGVEYKKQDAWTGAEFLESKIREAFATAEKNALPAAPKTKEDAAKSKDAGKRRRLPKAEPGCDSGTCPGTDAAPSAPESGTGDISPLFDDAPSDSDNVVPKEEQPGPQGMSPQAPSKPKWRRNDGSGQAPTAPLDQTDTGIIDKVTAPLTQKLDKLVDGLEQKAGEKLDSLTADLSQKAETIAREKIDEFKPEIITNFKAFLWSVIWRSAILIAIVWYGFYWIVRGLGWLCSYLAFVAKTMPRIKLESPTQATEETSVKKQGK